jgi:hypothetical protein
LAHAELSSIDMLQGIALARTALAAWDLINGRLVRPVDVSLRMSNTYWIVCPKVNGNLPKIAAFRKWLLAEAAEDARRLRHTGAGPALGSKRTNPDLKRTHSIKQVPLDYPE